MERFGGFRFSDMSKTVRKKRSYRSRRSENDSQSFPDFHDNSPLPSTPLSDNDSKASSDENTGHDRKEFKVNQCSSKASYTNIAETETALDISNKNERFGESSEACAEGISDCKDSGMDSKRSSEGVLAPANWKSTSMAKEGFELQLRTRDTQIRGKISGCHGSGQSGVPSDGQENANKLKKVKLKVGGVTRTIQAKSASDIASVRESSDAPRPRHKLMLQYSPNEDHSLSPEKGSGLRGIPWKDFSRSGFSGKKVDSSRGEIPGESVFLKQSDNYEPVRKSKRVPKRRLLDGALSDGDDEEICYLEKLKKSKVAADYSVKYEDEDEVGSKKHRRISRVLNRNVDGGFNVDVGVDGSSRLGKEIKKSRSGRVYEDTDYLEEEESVSDGEPVSKRNKLRKDLVDVLRDSKSEMAVTTRQQALHTGKNISSISGASLFEFPNGLPPAPARKQKDKLSEVEQQLKKAEAAQKRRMQVEKAARESEAEAIRKILGQDSSRKKQEHKIKKRQEELAQERIANAMTLASNTVRWVISPTGTVVTFPDDMGLPTIFEPKPCSYPPPREKCVGPSCTNPYKYRDSKLKLPLCSLQCYKAIQEKMQPMTTC